jgi:hypothetical protein
MNPAVADAPVSDVDISSGIADVFAESPGGSRSAESQSTSDSVPADIPGGEAPTPPPSTGDAPPSTPPGEGPTAPADSTGYQLTEDGNSYIVPKNDISTLGGFKDYAQKVQARFPTAADAETAHYQAADFRAIRADFLSGEENNINAVLNFFAGNVNGITPEEKAQFQSSFIQMIPKGLDMLKTVSPDTYSKLSTDFAQSEIDAAYQHAAETGSEDDLLAAQMLEWGRTGQYKTELPKQDPAKLAEQQFKTQQEELQRRETAAYNRDFKYFNDTQMDGPKWNAFYSEIEKVLAPVKSKYDATIFEAVKDRLGKEVLKKLDSDYEWSRDHNNDRTALTRGYQTAWRSNQSAEGLRPRIQAYQNDFMARVRRELPSIVAPLLGKATAAQQAAARPANAPRAAQPPAQQPAAPRAPNGQFQKQPANDWDIVEETRKIMQGAR